MIIQECFNKDGEKKYIRLFYETGEILSEINYENGEVISRKCWNGDGNEIKCE